jgi:hypothetical protein
VAARGDRPWQVVGDPDGRRVDGRPARLVVEAPDGRVMGSLPGSDRLVLDAFDDRPLGGQLTTAGLLVAGPADSLGGDGGEHALGLLTVPELRPRWIAPVEAPAERVASSPSLVAVLTRSDDGRTRLAVLR